LLERYEVVLEWFVWDYARIMSSSCMGLAIVQGRPALIWGGGISSWSVRGLVVILGLPHFLGCDPESHGIVTYPLRNSMSALPLSGLDNPPREGVNHNCERCTWFMENEGGHFQICTFSGRTIATAPKSGCGKK